MYPRSPLHDARRYLYRGRGSQPGHLFDALLLTTEQRRLHAGSAELFGRLPSGALDRRPLRLTWRDFGLRRTAHGYPSRELRREGQPPREPAVYGRGGSLPLPSFSCREELALAV